MSRDSRAGLHVGVAGLRGIPGVMGGIETHCEELYPRLIRLRPNALVVCVARAPYVKQKGPYDFAGVRVRPLPSTRSSTVEALLNTLLAVLYFGLFRRPDVLHLHGIGPALMTPLAKLLGLKLVVTHHGRDYRRAKWSGIARFVLRTGERLAVSAGDRVIAVSETLAQELKAEFPRSAGRIVYIPNGVSNLAASESEGRDPLEAFGLAAGGYTLSVGRLVPEKGFQDLIEAHRRSGASRPLVIAGGADHETDFVRGLRDQGSEGVIFTGMLPRPALGRLYACAALFVLASHHEGLPIAALEAAACGSPLLLSDIEANRDLGLASQNYFPVGDRDALAARLSEAPSTYAVDGGDISRRFDWDRVSAQTLEVYESL